MSEGSKAVDDGMDLKDDDGDDGGVESWQRLLLVIVMPTSSYYLECVMKSQTVESKRQ